MKAWNAFCFGVQKINKIALYFAVFCVVAMTGLITVEVFLRTFFSRSTMISDEYTGYLLCAMTFFGGAYFRCPKVHFLEWTLFMSVSKASANE